MPHSSLAAVLAHAQATGFSGRAILLRPAGDAYVVTVRAGVPVQVDAGPARPSSTGADVDDVREALLALEPPPATAEEAAHARHAIQRLGVIAHLPGEIRLEATNAVRAGSTLPPGSVRGRAIIPRDEAEPTSSPRPPTDTTPPVSGVGRTAPLVVALNQARERRFTGGVILRRPSGEAYTIRVFEGEAVGVEIGPDEPGGNPAVRGLDRVRESVLTELAGQQATAEGYAQQTGRCLGRILKLPGEVSFDATRVVSRATASSASLPTFDAARQASRIPSVLPDAPDLPPIPPLPPLPRQPPLTLTTPVSPVPPSQVPPPSRPPPSRPPQPAGSPGQPGPQSTRPRIRISTDAMAEVRHVKVAVSEERLAERMTPSPAPVSPVPAPPPSVPAPPVSQRSSALPTPPETRPPPGAELGTIDLGLLRQAVFARSALGDFAGAHKILQARFPPLDRDIELQCVAAWIEANLETRSGAPVRTLTGILEAKPDNEHALYYRGLVKKLSGDTRAALQDFVSLAKLNSRHAGALAEIKKLR